MKTTSILSSSPGTAILGAGSWGITLGALLLENSVSVTVWDIDQKLLDYIRSSEKHPRLPSLSLKGIQVSDDPVDMINNNELILLVIPSHAFRETAELIKKADWEKKTFLICTKGIEHSSKRLLSQVLQDVLGSKAVNIAILSGPSHAEEVANKQPASVTIASDNIDLAESLQSIFYTPYFRTYTNQDVIGVQIGGAVKNIIAIAAGVSDGLSLGDNAKAALITRGLAEIRRFGKKMKAQPLTLMGLSGLGDLVVTAMSRHSRNWTFGKYLGKGLSVQESLDKVEMVVEGYYTVKTMYILSRELQVEMPITHSVYRLIYENGIPEKEVSKLMEREVKDEIFD